MSMPRIINIPDRRNPGFGVPEDIQEQNERRGGVGLPGGGGMSQTVTTTSRNLSIFPPDVVTPKTGVQFQPYGQTTTNAAGQVIELWSFKVPASSILVIKSLDLYVNSVVPATDIQFGIFMDGVPWQSYGVIPIFPLPSSGLGKSFNDLTWRFPETRTVSCRVQNNDGGTHLVGSGAQGWYYNVAIDAIFNLGF